MAEFVEYGKTKRWFRDVIVTEKIDGTNAGIHIRRIGDVATVPANTPGLASGAIVLVGSDMYEVAAQSRNRLIYPGKATDNAGFAAWVRDNATALVEFLGEGLHFGEWWGKGINRGYGLIERRFALFNTDKYRYLADGRAGALLHMVPVLYQGPLREQCIQIALSDLRDFGSRAAPGFMRPEGIVIFHSQARMNFKVTLDNEDRGKWEAATP